MKEFDSLRDDPLQLTQHFKPCSMELNLEQGGFYPWPLTEQHHVGDSLYVSLSANSDPHWHFEAEKVISAEDIERKQTLLRFSGVGKSCLYVITQSHYDKEKHLVEHKEKECKLTVIGEPVLTPVIVKGQWYHKLLLPSVCVVLFGLGQFIF